MNDFMKLNCDEFLERLASKEPVPGGGEIGRAHV